MKKALSDLTAILILFWTVFVLLLAACGAQPPATATPAEDTPAITSTRGRTATQPAATSTPVPTSALGIEPDALQGVTVALWHPWSGALGQAIQDSIAAFNTGNPYGISAEGIYQGNFNDLYAKIDSATPDDLPDLVLAYTYQIRTWDSGDKPLADLDAYVNDPEWGFTPEERTDFYPVFFEQEVTQEKRFGFPIQRNAQVMYYNASWAQELGFDAPPVTPDDFKEQACAAAQANQLDQDSSNDGTGGWAVNTSPESILGWMYAFGSDILAPNGNGYRFNSSPVEETVAFLDDLRDSGCAWEPAGPYTETEFAERKAIFVSAPLSNHPYQNSELERAGNADAWSVIPFPSPDQRPAITVYGPELGMFEASSLEELAGWLLIKWLASPEQGARILLAGNGLPLRASTLEALGDYPAENPQWKQGLDLLDSANPEPNLPSWSVVRWVVSDVGTQIFRYYFTLDRTSATLELMDETAAELNARFENETGP